MTALSVARRGSRRRRRGAATAVATLAVVSLTACGSTVAVRGQQELTVGAGQGAAGGGVAGATARTGIAGAAGSTAAGGGAAGSAGPAGGALGGGTAATRVPGAAAASGPAGAGASGPAGSGSAGLAGGGSATGGTAVGTHSPVPVAVLYLNGGNAALSSAFPGSSVSFGDGKREAQAVINDVNSHGGVGGRRIAPTFVPVDAQNATDSGLQTACQGAVQDAHPLALLSMFNVSQGLVSCTRAAHVLLLDVALGAGDTTLYAAAPDTLFTPSQIDRDAEARLVLGLAHASGRLPSGAKVGVLVQSDDAMYQRVDSRTITPLLQSYGATVDSQTISTGADTSGISSAVLKFATAGVTTVVFSAGNGGIPEALFMQAADQQQYHPHYLMGDSTDPAFVSSAAPRAQAQNITGAGVDPLADVAATQEPSSPREVACLRLLNAAIGGYTNRGSSLTGTLYCELVWSFAFVGSRVSGTLTPASWVAAYRGVGTGYAPVTTHTADLVAGRNDNASTYRTLGWDGGCGCVTYTGGWQPLPAA